MPGTGSRDQYIDRFFINLFYLFIYFCLHWVFIAARGLSVVAASCLLIMVASVVAEHGL